MLARPERGFIGFVAYNVDTSWYRGSQPSGMVGQPLVYGSAARSSNNLYGDGAHAGGDTDLQAPSAAVADAQLGLVPVPQITDEPGSDQARLLGVGSPIGVITPGQAGVQYEDVHTGSIWISTGTTPQSWTQERNNP